MSEPTPNPAAKQNSSPRSGAADNARPRSAKQRAVTRRSNEADDGREEQDDEQDGAGRQHERVNADAGRGAINNRSRPAGGTIERKRSSQVRVAGERQQQYGSEYTHEQQDEEVDEEAAPAADDRQRARQMRRGGGSPPNSGSSRIVQQQQQHQQAQQGRIVRRSAVTRYTADVAEDEQQLDEGVGDGEIEYKQRHAPQSRGMQRPAVNRRANPQANHAGYTQRQPRVVQPQLQTYEDDEEVPNEDDGRYVYDEQRHQPTPLSTSQRRNPPEASTAQPAVRPAAASSRVSQLPSQRRPAQQPAPVAISGSGLRIARQPVRQEVQYDEYYGEEQEEVEHEAEGGSHVDGSAADDPLALYMLQSAAPLFGSSSSNKQQQQHSAPSVFSSLSAPSPVSNLSTSASRSAAKARVAAALSSELNLFDNFDPLTLHPAEQRALDRQQADMQAAFFTNPPVASLAPSLQQPPPPAYEVEPYGTNDEGVDSAAEQQSQQHEAAAPDLFSDLTAKLRIDDSDHPPPLAAPAMSRTAARPSAAKSVVSRSSAPPPTTTQRSAATLRSMQQSQPRIKQRQPAPAAAYEDEDEQLDGSEPNFL